MAVHYASTIRNQAVTLKRERPLSPHLQVYRWQITMTLSILHRATGVALALGAFGLVWWLVAVAAGGDTYQTFAGLAASIPGRIVLFAFSLCLFYHLLNGLRHLLWDIGWGLEIPRVYATGWSVLALTVVLTSVLWFFALNAGGLA
jgi:succinate dehydrogenase / fumarate reductase, cytochrome b subunit